MNDVRKIDCHDCSGNGVVGDYGAFGVDFEGPKECSTCDGSGTLTAYASGTLAKWPGGPLVGRTSPALTQQEKGE